MKTMIYTLLNIKILGAATPFKVLAAPSLFVFFNILFILVKFFIF